MFLARRHQLTELAAKNRLPAIYAIKEHAEAGGLMAHAASRPEIFRRAAAFVDKNSDKNSERRQPCRTPSGTADEIRTDHKYQYRQGPRPGHPADAARPRRRGDRMKGAPR